MSIGAVAAAVSAAAAVVSQSPAVVSQSPGLTDDRSKAAFVMDAEHCQVLQRHASLAVEMKHKGETYQKFVRSLIESYRYSNGKDVVIFENILPYSLEAGYEYFHMPFDPDTPYSRVVYERCMETTGTPSR